MKQWEIGVTEKSSLREPHHDSCVDRCDWEEGQDGLARSEGELIKARTQA